MRFATNIAIEPTESLGREPVMKKLYRKKEEESKKIEQGYIHKDSKWDK